MWKSRLMLQTKRRHPRVHPKPLQRHMAQQRGRNAGGKGWQGPTPRLDWPLKQQFRIRKGRHTAGGSGGSRCGNALAFSSPRGRQQQQQIKTGIPVTPCIEMSL